MGNINEKSKNENLFLKKQIQDVIKYDKAKKFKILLLGAGETGKSTLVKQMKIIHQNDYTKKERVNFRPIIFQNLIESLANILRAMKSLNIQFSNDVQQNKSNDAESFLYFASKNEYVEELNKDICCLIKHLWKDSDVQKCFSRSTEYELGDSAK